MGRNTSKWVVLGVCALVLHFFLISTPRQVVFDEVHFGKFISEYCCTGQRIFDIHPPHAKLLIAGAAKLGGYNGGFDFNHIGEQYPSEVLVFALRFVPALAGTILPLLIYTLLRQLGVQPLGALLGGAAVLLDNALTVQSRIISLDGVLLVGIFGSLVAFFAAEKQTAWKRAWLFLLAGTLAGLAVGAKFTGLVALVLLGLLVLVRLWQERYEVGGIPTWISRGVLILVTAASVYAIGWALHYTLLTVPGPADDWYQRSGNWWADTVTEHRLMLSANYGLDATHPDASLWWTWPFMGTSIFYWQGGESQAIYFLGSPVVWWGSTILFVIALISLLIRLAHEPARHAVQPNEWVAYAGFAISLLPLIQVPRALFLYHYLTPLLFSLIIAIQWLERKGWMQPKIVWPAITLLALGFTFFSPITYGYAVPTWWYESLFWLPSWR